MSSPEGNAKSWLLVAAADVTRREALIHALTGDGEGAVGLPDGATLLDYTWTSSRSGAPPADLILIDLHDSPDSILTLLAAMPRQVLWGARIVVAAPPEGSAQLAREARRLGTVVVVEGTALEEIARALLPRA